MKTEWKPSKKHMAIFREIKDRGFYKPTYSDQEPATKTLINKGICVWREDFTGITLTQYGKYFVESLTIQS